MLFENARKQPAEISLLSIFKLLGYFFLILLCLIAYLKFRQAEYFPIKKVSIFGTHYISHNDIQKIVTPYVNKGFFSVDVERIKDQIKEFAWVSHASVTRIWPDRVNISITEKHPVALWNENSLLSASGELFTPPTQTYPTSLPQLSGPEGEQILMAQYYSKMNNVLLPLHFKIARLELTPSMAWSITLQNGMKLSIGHKDVLTRLTHFVKVYPKIVGGRVGEVEYIDLRYQNGLAVKWKTVA